MKVIDSSKPQPCRTLYSLKTGEVCRERDTKTAPLIMGARLAYTTNQPLELHVKGVL